MLAPMPSSVGTNANARLTSSMVWPLAARKSVSSWRRSMAVEVLGVGRRDQVRPGPRCRRSTGWPAIVGREARLELRVAREARFGGDGRLAGVRAWGWAAARRRSRTRSRPPARASSAWARSQPSNAAIVLPRAVRRASGSNRSVSASATPTSTSAKPGGGQVPRVAPCPGAHGSVTASSARRASSPSRPAVMAATATPSASPASADWPRATSAGWACSMRAWAMHTATAQASGGTDGSTDAPGRGRWARRGRQAGRGRLRPGEGRQGDGWR